MKRFWLSTLLLVAPAWSQQREPGAAKPVEASVADVPGLPRVLLIGDSISIGYTPFVRELMRGVANVHRIPENGGPTIRGVANIEKWLGDGKWDVIHFNFGLHDLRIMEGEKRQVPLDDYEKNLDVLTTRMKQTGARLIFATTTPVPEGKVSPPRVPADVVRYNEAALRVMKKHGVVVNDLYAAILPRLGELQQPVNVHFKPEGSKFLAEKVAEAIRAALKK